MGAGSPSHFTQQAIAALQGADAVIALDKGEAKSDLLGLRQQLLAEHAPNVPLVTVQDPPRDRDPEDYRAEVRRWHAARAELIRSAIADHVPEGGTAAFLVWGDPSLYDSTLCILERVGGLDVRVVPGITAVQVLCAEHAILLNRIGEAIHITTGRKLAETAPADRRNCVVMLDGGAAWQDVATEHTYIWWGAYLGRPEQVLSRGYVHEIGAELAELKAKLRADHGWIMDTYLLRELDSPAPAAPEGTGD